LRFPSQLAKRHLPAYGGVGAANLSDVVKAGPLDETQHAFPEPADKDQRAKEDNPPIQWFIKESPIRHVGNDIHGRNPFLLRFTESAWKASCEKSSGPNLKDK
jgi:hypothetical protein